MKVLYVSKALRVAAYRAKLDDLARRVEVRAVIPRRWGRFLPEPGPAHRLVAQTALLHGHNHLHVYLRAGRPIDAFQPDLVHIDEEPYSAVTAQLARACRRRGVPCLFFAWQNIPKRLPAPFGALRGYVFRNAAGAIAGTEEAAGVLRSAGYAGPLAVIPQFGVDPDRFRPDPEARGALRGALGAGPDDVIVGYGGRLVREKGVFLLVDAVAELAGIRLVFLGDGPARPALERRAAAVGPGGAVHFMGELPSSEMPRHLAALDILVLPSITTPAWKEQFGRILVEAMACEVAVIGSTSGEIPRVIGDAGVIVPENDPAALRAALVALRDDGARRASLGRAARARVVDNYTSARIASDSVAFYEQVAACA